MVKIPTFCYQKAFWVLMPIIIISAGTGIAAINAQIDSLDTRVRNTEIAMANNDVPALKITLEKRFDKIDNSLNEIKSQTETIKAQNQITVKLFCVSNNIFCP